MKKSIVIIEPGELGSEIFKALHRNFELHACFKTQAGQSPDWKQYSTAEEISSLHSTLMSGNPPARLIILKNQEDRYSIAVYEHDKSKGNLKIDYEGKGYVRILYHHRKDNERDDSMYREICRVIKTTKYPVEVIHSMLDFAGIYDIRKFSKFRR